MNGTNLQKAIMLRVSKMGARIFRNNVGKSWVGKAETFRRATQVHVEPGDVVIRNARRLHSGLCKGSSDLIGWTPTEITLDMVGKTVAIFTAMEVKAGADRPTTEQKAFVSQVQSHGGIAGIVRAEEQAEDLVLPFLDSEYNEDSPHKA